MPRLNKQQIIYVVAGAAILAAILISYKALAALALLFFAAPPADKRRAKIKEQVQDAERDVKIQARAEQSTQEAKTDAGKRAAQDVDSFIDEEW